MFSGIIEEIGFVRHTNWSTGKIEIAAKKVLFQTQIGDSIAVNGACLTLTKILHQSFFADVSEQTLKKTNLKKLKAGAAVNLERAIGENSRFGGHIVSGHVDGIGKISYRENRGNAVFLRIECEKNLGEQIVQNGSIAVDGVSLTVTQIFLGGFLLCIIPHTAQKTILLQKKVGDFVNLELDILGKYVKNAIFLDSNENSKSNFCEIPKKREITKEFLMEEGFLNV